MDGWMGRQTDRWIEILDEWEGIGLDTAGYLYKCVLAGGYFCHHLNSLSQVRGDKLGLILMQIISMGSFSLSFLRFAVCQTWQTLQNQTRCCVMRHLVGLYNVRRCPYFVKLIKYCLQIVRTKVTKDIS